jgi:hypothetical protein
LRVALGQRAGLNWGGMGTTGNLVKIIHNVKDSGYRD